MLAASAPQAFGHDVSSADLARLDGQGGAQIPLFMYLGAKHMVTGYDHGLFLLGVMFLLRSARSVVLFASLFALGHTVTLLSGVYWSWQVSPYLVDAVIGLSVAYKGYDNLGGWARRFGRAPDERLMVGLFGLVHGLGLATKLQDFPMADDAVVPNLLAFNVGVELGQLAALWVILLALGWASYLGWRQALTRPVNVLLVLAGFLLCGYQLAGWLIA